MRLMWIVEISIKCCYLISTVCLICTELWNVIWIRELYWGLPHYRTGFPEERELNCLKLNVFTLSLEGNRQACRHREIKIRPAQTQLQRIKYNFWALCICNISLHIFPFPFLKTKYKVYMKKKYHYWEMSIIQYFSFQNNF